jgi:hypothetical protein
MEEWKQITDYPNYSVNTLGQVKNNIKNKLKIPFMNDRGYLIVDLYKNNVRKHFRVHQLVGKLFLPNWNNHKELDHRNRIKIDNRLINLRWCSRSDNQRNTKKRDGCSSKYKGVSFNKQGKVWVAEVSRKTIGRFKTEDDAYNAWKDYIEKNNLEKFYLI